MKRSVIMFRHGKPHLMSPMTDHYNLSLWITSTIGLAKLAAQFYFYQFNIVQSDIYISRFG